MSTRSSFFRLAAILAIMLLAQASAHTQQKIQQVGPIIKAPGVKIFKPGQQNYANPVSGNLEPLRQKPSARVSAELAQARKQLFTNNPQLHAKLTPDKPVVANRAGLNFHQSYEDLPFYGQLTPQAMIPQNGSLEVRLHAKAKQTYLFDINVYSSGKPNCKFTIYGPNGEQLEIPCQKDFQDLIFAFSAESSDDDFYFSIRGTEMWYFFSAQIDTQ